MRPPKWSLEAIDSRVEDAFTFDSPAVKTAMAFIKSLDPSDTKQDIIMKAEQHGVLYLNGSNGLYAIGIPGQLRGTTQYNSITDLYNDTQLLDSICPAPVQLEIESKHKNIVLHAPITVEGIDIEMLAVTGNNIRKFFGRETIKAVAISNAVNTLSGITNF